MPPNLFGDLDSDKITLKILKTMEKIVNHINLYCIEYATDRY